MIVYIGANLNKRYLFVRPTVNLALSAGWLKLQSADPNMAPAITYNFFDHPYDRERLRDGLRHCLSLMAHPSFQNIIAERSHPLDIDFDSDTSLGRIDVGPPRHRPSPLWHL